MKTKITKDQLRKNIAQLKKEYTPLNLESKSEEVFSVFEIIGEFQSAKNIFIYHNLSDEVATVSFIEKWAAEKNFYLPVVENDKLVFRLYHSEVKYEQSKLGILEPLGDNFEDYHNVDIVIVPGVAFDRKMNRLGRGKGYYDSFLSNIKAKKIGVCFDFQLFDSIPNDLHDIKMDMIVSENELIW